MNALSLLAMAILTEKQGVNQQVLEPLAAQQDISRELPPLTQEPIAQVTPLYQLEVQSSRERFTPQPNQPQSPVEDATEDATEVLQPRTSAPDVQQFSPTVFLEGEAILGVSGVSGGGLEDQVVFQEGIELIFNASFTGEDLLQVGLESGNSRAFSFVDELTFEGRLQSLAETEDDRVELSELSYEFPIGDRASLYLSTTGDNLNDFNPILASSSDGAISEFGTENPIHSLVGDTGLQLDYDLTYDLGISLGYFSSESSNPNAGAGLFNGNQSTFVQLGFEPSDSFLLGLTYIHTYNDSSLETETGSLRSQINLERPVVGNSYGISASFLPSPRVAIGGWVGYTHATVIGLGEADVWNYALTLALLDFGKEDNLLGLVIGQEPRLTGTSGFAIDDRSSDPDTSLHLEAFYSYRLSDYISVTPGLIWITAPNHDQSNPDIIIFTVRTAFEF
jgi:hypothetical protein